MSNTNEFNSENLDPTVVNQALQSLSEYYISKRRLKIRERTLGVGGSGTVKLAELWPSTWIPFGGTSTIVAVKELHHDEGVLRTAARLAREVKVWAPCKHENVLEFIGYYLSKDFITAYLVSPYMANGNIKDYLDRELPDQKRRLELAFCTINGLAYLHSRNPPIVHGDLKSLNVLVNNEGEALLGGFGHAEEMEYNPTGLSISDGFRGTIRYCSPEVVQGSPRELPSDIWAWGCLALEIITGNPPYHEILTDYQVLMLVRGRQDRRKTPEPSDISSLPSAVLTLLRMCWSFELGQRPHAQMCVDEIQAIVKVEYSRDNPDAAVMPWIEFSTTGEGEVGHYRQRSATATAYGGFSDIFQCDARFPDGSCTLVAVKRLRAVKMSNSLDTYQIDRKLQKRLDREVKIWVALQHPNIAPLLGFSLSGEVCIISPWFTNGNIAAHLEANPDADRMELIRQVAAGVAHLHCRDPKVVHGDLKPDNVLIDIDGVAKLIDFGLSKAVEVEQGATGLSSTSLRNTGNVRWIAPELLLEENASRSGSTDTFSFGCVAFFIFTGDVPFKSISDMGLHIARYKGAQPMPNEADYPGFQRTNLVDILRFCWKENPTERPMMSVVAQRLDSLGSSGPSRTVPSRLREPSRPSQLPSSSSPDRR